MQDTFECQICASDQLAIVEGVDTLGRVTSDSQPFRSGAAVGVCRACGTVQSLVTETWKTEIAEIYTNYQIYKQSRGIEQGVVGEGNFQRRSSALVQHIRASGQISGTGRLIDIGCGNGAMLRSFHEQLPAWTLHGLELDDKYRKDIESIPGAKLFVGELADLEGEYDLITMLHALEHFINPDQILREIASKLSPAGLLFIEVPNFAANPFDLIVADHSVHYTTATLSHLLGRSGFEIVANSETWVAKELSFLARYRGGAQTDLPREDPSRMVSYTNRTTRWLRSMADAVTSQRAHDQLGLLGTSLAATWLFSELDGAVDFFVDEDTTRVGTYFDKPVLLPEDVAAEADVILPFPPAIAMRIAERLNGRPFNLIVPPPLA